MPKGTVSHARQMIKTEELIDKAQDSLLLPNNKENPALTSAEVGIIKTLLNKTIPDLKGVEHTGSIDSVQTHKHKVKFVSSK